MAWYFAENILNYFRKFPLIWSKIGWHQTESGISITQDSMLTQSVIWACTKVLSETIASLPLHLMEETKSGKFKAVDHPLYEVLHDKANPLMTAMSFRQAMQMRLPNAGAAYAEIIWAGERVKELWPLDPLHIRIDLSQPRRKKLFYRDDGGSDEREINYDSVFDLLHMTPDGLQGFGIVDYAARTIGNAIAADIYTSKFFASGGRTPGIVKLQKTFRNPEEAKAYREDFEKKYSGPENTFKTMFTDAEMDYKPLGISPRDAQFIEYRNFSTPELCRWYRVPPHLVMDLLRATFSNISEQGEEFVRYTMMPVAVTWEQAINMKLLARERLTEKVRTGRRLFAKFNFEGLLRGNYRDRMQAYAQALQNGITSINEVRGLEDLNPVEGGDAHHIQLNMQSVSGEPTASQIATLKEISNGGPKNGSGNGNG